MYGMSWQYTIRIIRIYRQKTAIAVFLFARIHTRGFTYILCIKKGANMNKIICINPPKFIKAILKFFSSFKKGEKSE